MYLLKMILVAANIGGRVWRWACEGRNTEATQHDQDLMTEAGERVIGARREWVYDKATGCLLAPFNVVEDREEETSPAATGIEQERVGEM